MCSNYEFPSKEKLSLLNLHESQLKLDFKQHVYPLYDAPIIEGHTIRSFSLLTINAEHHPFMSQFHGVEDEKRSIIIIPEKYRQDWLTVSHLDAHELFFTMDDEFISTPYNHSSDKKVQGSLF